MGWILAIVALVTTAFVGIVIISRENQSPSATNSPAPPATNGARGVPAGKEETYPILYFISLGIFVVLSLILYVWTNAHQKFMFPIAIAWWLYVLLSTRLIKREERGAIMLLEIPLLVWPTSMPVIVLFGLMKMQRFPKAPFQRQFPGESDDIFHGDDKEALPPGMVRATRITTGAANATYNDPLLNARMTTEVTGTARLYISDPFTFWSRMAGKTLRDKIREAIRQMNDTWSNTARSEFAKRPAGQVIDEGDTIAEAIKAKLENACSTWGLYIVEVNLYSPDLTHKVSGALADIVVKNAEATQTRATADATGYATRVEGEGQAAADLAIKKAAADGDKYTAEQLEVDPKLVFAADAAARVIGDKDKVIFGGGGLAEAIGSGVTIIEALGTASKAKPANTTQPERNS